MQGTLGGWNGGKNDLVLEILVAVTDSSPLDVMCSASCVLGGDGSHLGAATITVDICGVLSHGLLRASLLEQPLSADLGISYYLSVHRVMG